jgi:hypothetical protein
MTAHLFPTPNFETGQNIGEHSDLKNKLIQPQSVTNKNLCKQPHIPTSKDPTVIL